MGYHGKFSADWNALKEVVPDVRFFLSFRNRDRVPFDYLKSHGYSKILKNKKHILWSNGIYRIFTANPPKNTNYFIKKLKSRKISQKK